MPHEGGRYSKLKASLLKLRELKVDVILCSVALGKNTQVEVTPEEWTTIIDGIIEKCEVKSLI
jgi:hypothetical protein